MASLAVLYRPKTFEEMCGQKSVIAILKKQIETGNIKNCYLFAGSSGIGKTTAARAFANLINKNKGEPIEIDAASNNGVDNVRAIIEEAQTRAIDSEYKIFIIDEVHMLSNAAFNALLKTFEEPPAHTIFMLCTTNPEKIPATIQNRVMRFNLTKISTQEIYNRLLYVCKNEHFSNYEETCDYIAKIANGGMRDALAALEKVSDYSHDLSINNTLEILGSYAYSDFFELTNAIIDNREGDMLGLLERFDQQGKDLKFFIDQYLSFILDLTKYTLFKDMSVTKLPLSLESSVQYSISFDKNISAFNTITDNLLQLKAMLRNDENPALTIKAAFVQLSVRITEIW